MARRTVRTFQRGGRVVRETMWIEISTVESTLSGAPTAVLANSLSVAALALRPFTIVRTRGVFHVRSDQVAASESYGGDMALAVVSDQASAIGVTAVPTPLTDKGSDLFFVYEQRFGQIGVSDATGIREVGFQSTFDSKAMRKVNDDQDVILVVENELAGVVLITSGRMLVKLH